MDDIKQTIKELLVILTMVFSLLGISLYLVMYIVQNYVDLDLFMGKLQKNIYVISNDKDFLYLKKHLKYKIQKVESIKGLSLNSILIVLKKVNNKQLINYLKKGGYLITNQNFLDLKPISDISYGSYRLLSPSLSYININKKIQLFDNIKSYKGFSLLDITSDYKSYPVIINGKENLGEWMFFTLPIYVIKNNLHILNQMIQFAMKGYSVVKYPYIDTNKAVFITNYNYYKFNPISTSLPYTLFINPKIAIPKLSNNIELASTNIKNTLDVEGFSNENISPLIDILLKNNYTYTIAKNEKLIDDFVVLSNQGFNDISDEVEDFDKKLNFYLKYGSFNFAIHPYVLGFKQNQTILQNILKKLEKYPIYTAKQLKTKILDKQKIKIKVIFTIDNLNITIINNTLKDIKNFKFRIYSKHEYQNIESSFLNVKAKIIKQTKTYADIQVDNLKKNIELNLFLRLKK